MKILHTSDWHLGQNFFTKSRKPEHQAFLTELLRLVVEREIDAIIVAGDVFDTATPPSYAREMYNEFVVDLQKLNCTLIVLGGNHDSVSVLNESRQLLACLNTYVIASTDIEPESQVIELKDKSSKVAAIVCGIPYIRPRDVIKTAAGQTGLEKRQALADAIAEHYQEIYQLAYQQREQLGYQVPIIATGHLSALGVSQSESVRDIYIGSMDGFDAKGFPPADYIALGHIHKPQMVAKSEHIRYSGSPLPLSFDEVSSTKQVLLINFELESDTPTQAQVESISMPEFRPMKVLKGDLKELEQQLSQLEHPSDAEPLWLSIEVQTQDFLTDLQQRIQDLCEGLNVDVLQLRRDKKVKRHALKQQQRETLSELTPQQVFDKRLAMESFDGDEEQARLARMKLSFSEILAELEQGEDHSLQDMQQEKN